MLLPDYPAGVILTANIIKSVRVKLPAVLDDNSMPISSLGAMLPKTTIEKPIAGDEPPNDTPTG